MHTWLLTLSLYVLSVITGASQGTAQSLTAPLYDSTADTVFDLIHTADPSTFLCARFVKDTNKVLWDKRIDGERPTEAFQFEAYFEHLPAPITFLVNAEFGRQERAMQEVLRIAPAFGRLPLIVQTEVQQIGIHDGMPTFSAGPGKIFLYSDRVTRRISQNKLEESLFHEAVHASLDTRFARSQLWRDAQSADPGFLTQYGANNPAREDLAESALFAYAIQRYPGRLPPVDTQDVLRQIPNRLTALNEILEADSGFGQNGKGIARQRWKDRCHQ